MLLLSIGQEGDRSVLIKDAIIGHDAQYTNQVETIFNAMDLNTINYMFKIRRE